MTSATRERTSLFSALVGVALVTGALLLIPLVAMQFTSEVVWGPGDFIVAAALLFSAGAVMVVGVRRFRGGAARASIILATTLVLAVVWAELAVGLFR